MSSLFVFSLMMQKSLYYIDGGKKLRDTLGEEPILPLTEWITQGARELTREEVTDVSISNIGAD